jgi:hypothetical protein
VTFEEYFWVPELNVKGTKLPFTLTSKSDLFATFVAVPAITTLLELVLLPLIGEVSVTDGAGQGLL